MIEILYRYAMATTFYDNGEISSGIHCHEYAIQERTPCGAWVAVDETQPYSKTNRKWVSIGTRKAWAYPTKAEALNSLRERVKWRCFHLERQLDSARFSQKVLAENFDAIVAEAARSKHMTILYSKTRFSLDFEEVPVFKYIMGY